MTIRINLDKRIGNVLFVVEGAKTEFSILKRVFCSILDYSFVESRRGSLPRFLNRNDRNSCVAVVNTINGHIASITREEEYLDSVYSQLITEFNMSQKEFSEKTGIPQSTISEWKSRKTNPASDKIMIICQAFGVSPEWLLSGTDTAGNRGKKGINDLFLEIVIRIRE